MTKEEWVELIINDMKLSNTYKDSYVPVANTLADILERRDLTMDEWRKGKCKLLVQKKSDRGAVNKVKNPLIQILQECEKDALTYWSQLGLTPNSLKKAFSEDIEATKKSTLADALKNLSA